MKNVNTKPSLIIVAGPNGAGKSTFITEYLHEKKEDFQILNYDLILKAMHNSGYEQASITAGKELLKTFNRFQKESISFIYETVLSDTSKYLTNKIVELQKDNWDVVLYYLWMSSYKISRERVQQRIEVGGHSVQEDLLEKRYTRSLHNFINTYLPLCKTVYCVDNEDIKSELIFSKINGEIQIVDENKFNKLKEIKDEK